MRKYENDLCSWLAADKNSLVPSESKLFPGGCKRHSKQFIELWKAKKVHRKGVAAWPTH